MTLLARNLNRPSRLAGFALAAALVAPVPAKACSMAPFFFMHREPRSIAVLVTPTSESVEASWGDVGYRQSEWRRRSLKNTPIRGQVVDLRQAGGPGGAGINAGRAVLVPWAYDLSCATVPWDSSPIWLPPGSPEAVVGRLRKREDWVDGVPTIDVVRPDLVRGSGMRSIRSPRNVETAETLFSYYAAVPSIEQLERDPWAAVATLRV